jgi:hypothetical protein
MSVKAKFVVTRVFYYPDSANTEVHMQAVVGPTDENKAFWNATPSGTIQMNITNKDAAVHFVLEREFYVDFTPA